jgi:hypothetical protein
LSAQILASTLFGFMGLALADPIVAMIKVALESEAERAARAQAQESRGFHWRVRHRDTVAGTATIAEPPSLPAVP